MLRFAEFSPDIAGVGLPGSDVIKNVYPIPGGFGPWRAISPTVEAAPARVIGATHVLDSSRNARTFLATTAKIQEASGGALTDRTNTGGDYTTGALERFRFAQIGQDVIATNFSDPMQRLTMGTDTAFSDLANAPNAKHVFPFRTALFAGNTNLGGSYIQASDLGDVTSWTPSDTNNAITEELDGGGEVTGFSGREVLFAYTEKAIDRLQFVGGAVSYQIDRVSRDRGCKWSGSLLEIGQLVFMWTEDGVFVFNGASLEPIGHGRVDNWITDNFNTGAPNRLSVGYDHLKKCVVWGVPGSTDSPQQLLIYCIPENRWSFAEVPHDIVFSAQGTAFTVEQLDLLSTSVDALDVSPDSRSLRGGTPFLGAVDTAHQYGGFSGAVLPAELETVTLGQGGKRTLMQVVYPVHDAETSTVGAYSANRQVDPLTLSETATVDDEGYARLDAMGRYHRLRVNIPSQAWTRAQGVQIIESTDWTDT